MIKSKSRREIQRRYAPGTLFTYYDLGKRKLIIALVLGWYPVEGWRGHPATWHVSILQCGEGIDVFSWSVFNLDNFAEIISDSKECK